MEAKLLVFIAIACAVSYVKAGTVYVNVTTQAPNMTRSGCGSTKLCFNDCDPAVNASKCFYGSSRLDNNTAMVFELSGPTSGYVALGLATNLTVGATIVFVCGNSNSSGFVFLTASNSNNTLNLSTNVNTVNSVQGVVTSNQSLNQTYIQCVFTTSVNLTTTTTTPRSSFNSYYVSILSGVMDGITPGSSSPQFSSNTLLDLTDPKANVVSTTNSTNTNTNATTVASPTQSSGATGGSNPLSSPAARALAILLSAIGLLLLS